MACHNYTMLNLFGFVVTFFGIDLSCDIKNLICLACHENIAFLANIHPSLAHYSPLVFIFSHFLMIFYTKLNQLGWHILKGFFYLPLPILHNHLWLGHSRYTLNIVCTFLLLFVAMYVCYGIFIHAHKFDFSKLNTSCWYHLLWSPRV
mgnify:CR=1 FL=1